MTETMTGRIGYMPGDMATLELYKDRVLLTPKGLFARVAKGLYHGGHEILLRNVTGLHLVEGYMLRHGFLQVKTDATTPNHQRYFDGIRDPASFSFAARYNDKMRQIRDRMQELSGPGGTFASSATGDVAAGLRNLSDLHRQGQLTDAEFAAAKHRVLNPPKP